MLAHELLDRSDIKTVVATALTEDLRYGHDITSHAVIPANAKATALLVPRVPGVLAGVDVALEVFDAVMGVEGYHVLSAQPDGSALCPGKPALVVFGSARGLLTAERTALNLLSHLSGIATATNAWVSAVEGTASVIRDSRKTLPGLRTLQKYAVRCGGGINHRFGLGDAILVKDNHIRMAGSVSAVLAAVRHRAHDRTCEIEIDSLEQLDELLTEHVDIILLDNFTPQDCARAVARVRAAGCPSKLEASGGLTLESARAYAESGVDYLAVGRITHSAPALDIGLDFA